MPEVQTRASGGGSPHRDATKGRSESVSRGATVAAVTVPAVSSQNVRFAARHHDPAKSNKLVEVAVPDSVAQEPPRSHPKEANAPSPTPRDASTTPDSGVRDVLPDHEAIPPTSAAALVGVGEPIRRGETNFWTGLPTQLENGTSGCIFASATSTAATTHAIDAFNDSPQTNSVGVRGVASATVGETIGVEGVSRSIGGVGVRGFSSLIGVSGYTNTGVGVRGFASAGSGQTVGVLGTCASPEGVGVLADNTAPQPGLAVHVRTGDLAVGEPANPWFRVTSTDPQNGQTALLVRRNVNGVLSTQRVSVGPANSGGNGFRVLRVPN
jgi:hypothetical protein